MAKAAPAREPQRFTEYFGLNVEQSDLDFLDIYADCDIRLFLDPFGISAMGTRWARECETEIATYFQFLVDSIRLADRKTVKKLLDVLHEVPEVALGYAADSTKGRGIGEVQARDIQTAFETSSAGKSGDIKDIADCALMIPGINHDKVSDITANILKQKLVQFTQEQCRKHNIPMKRVAVNNVFDSQSFGFKSFYADLPVVNGKPKILLPLSGIRREPELSKDKYYRNFVLEFLKAEHEHAGDSLAHVLRNGAVVVRIGDLKGKYPLRTEFLYEFSKEHPKVLQRYKADLRQTAITAGSSMRLKTKRKILTAEERMAIFADIEPGNAGAHDYHKLAFDSLIHIFGDRVSNPLREAEINEGRKRIDIVFDNSDREGFFHDLNALYHVKCPKISAECKNYGKEVGNPEVDQLAGRMNGRRGRFGILLCRSVRNRDELLKRCKDQLNDNGNYIIVLDDNDMKHLLELTDAHEERKIDEFMRAKLDKLIM